ncbi:hypothetical protein TRFO_25345 [Tritrichomonas foetus]|uniref:Uncharacterized protein n=1 Tax=Tritrichomonas foetus TaxID=1144522 RepID=A0A1J4KAA5_9EUKA|nr:hypothetical protein TRFO_25345 [Tritrichomonas foetus]|eukprot:OHT06598.1 hypothetical protein TRFO_25345 [Tritrichomonas foetus]
MFTFHLDPVDKGTNFDWRISVNNIEVECIKINVIQHSKVIRSFVNKTPDAPLFSIILENEYYDHSLLTNFFQCQDVRLTDENYLFLKELLSELKIDTFNDKIDAFQHLLEEIQKKDTLLRNLYSCKKYLINVIESHECNLPDVVVNCVTMLDNIGDIEFFQIIFSCCVARPDSIDFYIDLIKQIDNQIPLLDQFKHYVEFEYQNSLEIDHFEVQCESRYILTKLSNTFESSQHDDTTSNSTNNNNTQEIIEIIRKDNIDALKAYIFDHNIEDYTTIKYSFNENEKCTILQKDKPTLLEIAAFFGAVKCFKYFLLNNDKVSFILAKYAVAGGNTEIIHICAQNKCIFVHTLNIAVKYHRFKVFNWIVETFKSNLSFSSFLIETAFKYCEIQIIFYLLKNGYFSPDFLIESVKSNNLILYQFFLPMVDINSISSIDGFTSLHAACFNGNLDMVTLILQQPGVEINKIVNSVFSK